MCAGETTQRQAVVIETLEVEEAEPTAAVTVLRQLVQVLNPQSRVCISDAQVDFLISEVDAFAGAMTPGLASGSSERRRRAGDRPSP